MMMVMLLTYEVGEVETIGEAAGRTTSWIVNAIRRRVGACRGWQIVVVTIVNQRVAENKESTG